MTWKQIKREKMSKRQTVTDLGPNVVLFNASIVRPKNNGHTDTQRERTDANLCPNVIPFKTSLFRQTETGRQTDIDKTDTQTQKERKKSCLPGSQYTVNASLVRQTDTHRNRQNRQTRHKKRVLTLVPMVYLSMLPSLDRYKTDIDTYVHTERERIDRHRQI